MAAAALRALMSGLVDYAGLFPPAALTMDEAARSYARHLASAGDAWMLGRFVVPAARLDELAAVAKLDRTDEAARWRLSVLFGDDLVRDAAVTVGFGARHRASFAIEAVEVRATTADVVEPVARLLPRGVIAFVEIDASAEPRAPLRLLKRLGLQAKIRTGGLTPDAIPRTEAVARFIRQCAEEGVPFKATAGLHHPLRGEHPLTYAPDAPAGTMFGFLNVFLAAAFAHAGRDDAELISLLEERESSAFRFTDTTARWRGHTLSLAQIAGARASLGMAFGSCSFTEPVGDLHQMGLL